MLNAVGEYVDRLMNVKLTPHLRTHDAAAFYEPARRAQGGRPLSFLAAQALTERVREGDYVLILHNAGIPPYLPHGETDGPVGAASLARALNWGLGARPVFVAEAAYSPPMYHCATAAGLRIVDRDTVEVHRVHHAAQVVDFPLGADGAVEEAVRLLNAYRPVAVLAVERLGPNTLDRFHSGVGYLLPSHTQAHVHCIVEEAMRRGILTIGFGDGGNELGYGLIADVVNAVKAGVLNGRTCQCGCGGGIATRVRTDILVSAATSNWGAYAVSALIALVEGDLASIQDEEMEYRMLEAAVRAGAVDASTGAPVMSVDGTSVRASQAIITLLRELIANALRGPYSRLFPEDAAERLARMA